MTGILVALYGEAKAGWIAVLVMLALLLLVGEVTPKTIAVSNPRRISAGFVAGPLSRWVRLIAPLRWCVRNISDRITTWSQACLEMLALELEDRLDEVELVNRIQRALDHVHHLYEEVRDYAAPINLDRQPCDLAHVWRDSWSHLEVA